MKNPKKEKYSSKLSMFNDVSISKKDQEKISGGFLAQMLDDVRCSLERSFSLYFGGNGDGDW